MATGPTIEHDGHTYERSQGGWTDLGTNMRAQAVLSQELDRLARLNPALWTSCKAHDASQGVGRPKGGRLSEPGYGLSADFIGEARHIRLTADIASGWRATVASWRYSARQVIDLQRGGWVLGCTVEVVEDTRTFPKYENGSGWHQTEEGFEIDTEWLNDTSSAAIPSFPTVEDREREIAFCVRESTAIFEVPIFSDEEAGTLNPHLQWKRRNGLWRFGDTRGGTYARAQAIPENMVSRAFSFTLTAVLHEPRREPIGPTREYDLPLPSAGLPSLGRRR